MQSRLATVRDSDPILDSSVTVPGPGHLQPIIAFLS